MLVFLYHCISDANQLFSENVGCHFYFILYIMSDKAAFVTRALFCVERCRGNLELSRSNSASRWQIINLHLYAATKSVTPCPNYTRQDSSETQVGCPHYTRHDSVMRQNQSNITANQKSVWAGSPWKRTALATKLLCL